MTEKNNSPVRLLIITTVCSFLAEALATALFNFFFPSSKLIDIVADAFLSTALIIPLLYVFMLRPLTIQIRERKHAEEALQKTHDQLEIRIRDRTEQLANANRVLYEQIQAGEELKAELIRNVEELKSTQEKLLEQNGSLYRLAGIVESSDDSIIGLTLDGTITSWNSGAERIYGYTAEEAIGKSVIFLTSPEHSNDIPQILERVRQGDRIHHYETVRLRKDGQSIQVSLTVSPIKDSNGKIIGVSTIARDITERKKAEEALRRFELLSTNTQDIILYMQRDEGHILEANAAATKAYGYSREELLDLTIHDLRAPTTQGLTADQMVRADATGILFETTHQRKDGSTFPVEVSSQGATIGGKHTLISVIRDITGRKQAEEALRTSQEDLAHAQAVAHTGSWRLDVRGNQLLWSDETYRMFGIPKGTPLTYEAFLDRVHPDDRDLVNRSWLAAMRGAPYDIEHRILVAGVVKWVRERAELEFDQQGVLQSGFGAVQDITGRKQAEQALRDSEERYRSLFNSMTEGFAIHELITDETGRPCDYRFLNINPAFERMTGLKREDVVGRTHNEVLPDDDPKWVSIYGEVALTGKPVHFENYSSALKKHFEVSSYRPAPNQFAVIFMDITTRKETEEVLQKAYDELGMRVQERTLDLSKAIAKLQAEITERKKVEAQLRIQTTALEAAVNGIFITDAEGKVQWANPAFTKMTGYSWESVLGQNPRFLKSGKQDRQFYKQMWDTILSGQDWRSELVNRRFDGTFYYEELTITPVLDENQKVIHFIAILHDITERKQAEENIRERNQKLEELYQAELHARRTAETLRSASLALTQTLNLHAITNTLLEYISRLVPYDSASVILFDDDTLSKVWAMSGYDRLIDPVQVLAEYFQPQSNPFIRALMTTQQTILISNTTKETGWISLPNMEAVQSWLGVPLVGGGRLIGLCEFNKAEEGFFTHEHIQWIEALAGQSAVVIQNAWLFEQVRAGRERLQSLSHRLVELQENERRYIARELHDEAGQILTSLMIGLELLEREANHPEAVVAGIANLNRLVDSVLEDLHRLAIDLRPATLDQLGLVSALHQYIENLSEKHKMVFNFQTDGITERLPSDIEIALYRIVQEALTNVIRHAHASRVDILLEQHSDQVVVMVEDNGIGFDPTAQMQPEKLGLFGMQERVEMLSGSLSIESSAGNGTTMFVKVPYVHSDPCRG